MLVIQLPKSEPIDLSEEQADRLYDALWANTATRGSVTAAARVKAALTYMHRHGPPLEFEAEEASAVLAALAASGLR